MYSTVVTIKIKNSFELRIASDIIDFNCTENLKNGNVDMTPGICEQSAQVTFYDKDKSFVNLVKRESVDFFYGSLVTISAGGVALGDYMLDTIDIDGDSRQVTLRCVDYSNLFADIFLGRLDVTDRTVTDFLDIIFNQALKSESYVFMDNETRDRCNSIVVKNSYLLKQSVIEALTKVCQLAFINIIYKNGNFRIARCL